MNAGVVGMDVGECEGLWVWGLGVGKSGGVSGVGCQGRLRLCVLATQVTYWRPFLPLVTLVLSVFTSGMTS